MLSLHLSFITSLKLKTNCKYLYMVIRMILSKLQYQISLKSLIKLNYLE